MFLLAKHEKNAFSFIDSLCFASPKICHIVLTGCSVYEVVSLKKITFNQPPQAASAQCQYDLPRKNTPTSGHSQYSNSDVAGENMLTLPAGAAIMAHNHAESGIVLKMFEWFINYQSNTCEGLYICCTCWLIGK